MRFKIFTLSPFDGKQDWVVYDNIANRIYSKRGIPLCLSFDPRFESVYKESLQEGKRDRQYPKSRHLKALRIQVGVNCNFRCKYCGQRSYEKVIPIVPNTQSKVDDFISRLSSCVDSIEKISFTGGEVFVYKKRLVPLVEGLKTRYPDAKLGLITNGSLLTESIADWLIDNRVSLVISHDGPTFTRYRNEKDILDNPVVLSAIRRYFDRNTNENLGLNFRLSAVITPENCHLSLLPAFFQEKIGRAIKVQFESIVKVNRDTLDAVSPFSSESANLLINEMLQAGANRSTNNPLSCVGKLADRVVRRLVKEEDLRKCLYPCDNAQADTLSVDLDGNLLACQGLPAVRTGYGKLEDLERVCATNPVPWTARQECSFCPFLVSCLGGCSIQRDEDHEITCRTLRLWNMGIFYVAWLRMFNTVIQSIDPFEANSEEQSHAL